MEITEQKTKRKRGKNKGGRPPKLTPDTVRKLEEAFAIDATVEEACFYADISRETYYQWVRNNKKLADRFEALRNKPVLKARQTVVQKVGESYDNAMDYLKRKRKKEFAELKQIGNEDDAPFKLDVTIKQAIDKAYLSAVDDEDGGKS